MKSYRHLVWDWNGTLLDDAWLCREIMNQLMVRRGLEPVSAGRYQQVFGFPLREYCRQLGFDLEAEPYEAISDEFMVLYERRRLECSLRRGALQALESVRLAGLGQSVLSAYREQYLRELVAHFALEDYFAAVIGLDDHYAEGKVERGRRFIEELAAPAGEVVLVGDTLHDVEVAQAMGVDCVLVLGGHQSRQRLEASGVVVAADLGAVLALLNGEESLP